MPLLESKAVIPSSNIFLNYSDLAKVLTLIGALTCYSWVCFKQAKATNLSRIPNALSSIVGLIDRNKWPGILAARSELLEGADPRGDICHTETD